MEVAEPEFNLRPLDLGRPAHNTTLPPISENSLQGNGTIGARGKIIQKYTYEGNYYKRNNWKMHTGDNVS